jgi:hypothetical protein
MDHERFAPLLFRIVLAGLLLGVMALVQAVIGYDSAASPLFMKLAYVFLLVTALSAYMSHRLNQTYGLLAALLFVTTPPFLIPSHVGLLFVEPVFYWTSVVFCLFLWSETGKLPWLIMGGLCMGFAACGVSWDSALFFVVLYLGVLVLLRRRTKQGGNTMGYATLFVLCGVVPFASWNAVSYFSSGNVFAALLCDQGATAAQPVQGGVAEGTRVTTMLESIPQSIFLLPWGESLLPPTLTLGPAAVCFLPWAFKGKWGHEKRVLAVAVLVIVFMSYTGALKTLGFLPIIPLLAVLAIYGIHNLYMNVKRPSLLFSAVAVLLAWNGVTFWKYFV